MSGFDGFNTDFFQTSYSIEDQAQPYDYSRQPYSKPYGGYEYPQQAGFVPPDMMQQQQPYTGQIYQPTQGYTPASAQSFYGSNFEDEPPLLEELGINFDHIWQKTLTVLHPLKVADGNIMNETDLAGPMVFCLAFGATLLLRGAGDYPHSWNYWLVQLFCFQDLYLCLSHGGPAAAGGLSLCTPVRSLRPHLRLLSRPWGLQGPGGKSQPGTWTWTRSSCKQPSPVAIMNLRPVGITWNNGKRLLFTFLGLWILFSMTWAVQSFNMCSCLSSSVISFPFLDL